MILQEAFDLFMLSMRGVVSRSTCDWYQRRLSDLVGFIGEKQVEAVTSHDLRRWRAALADRDMRWANHRVRRPERGGLSAWTIHGYVRTARRFFRWLKLEGILESNPAERLELPKLPKDRKHGISQADIERFIVAAAASPRDLALVLFLASTACRVGGVVSLRLSALDLDKGQAIVREKGNKERVVFLAPGAVRALRAWLAVRPTVAHKFVFVGRGGKAMTTSGVYQVLKRLARRAGVTSAWNPHAWRHGVARLLQARGMPTGVLSQILGHSDVSVTVAFYGTCTDDELKRAHDQYNFLD